MNSQILKSMKPVAALVLVSLAAGCAKKDSGFSLLADSQSFQQNNATVNNKLDVLWVVDNSGSMDSLQTNLANNISSFMSNFIKKSFDFKMAVTTSDAYLSGKTYLNNPSLAAFKDGVGTKHSGFPILTPSTPNLLQTFITNATQGSGGNGDERAFQSMIDSLLATPNQGFLRQGAFFAIVILSDEDDFTDYTRAANGGADHSYTNAKLMSVDQVITQMDVITGSSATKRRWSASAITVLDSTCLTQHKASAPSAIIGKRYVELANKTKGTLGSVCDTSFAKSLEMIQQQIAELTSSFTLKSEPNPSTLQVIVDGVVVAQNATTGWTYEASTWTITFHGQSVPPTGAAIQINFDPIALK